VFFRQSTRERAQDLALSGWVRNLPDGRVEAVFHGPRSVCEQALAWIGQGPPSANVTGVEHRWEQDPGDFGEWFEIR
jgi:acylphosphatase